MQAVNSPTHASAVLVLRSPAAGRACRTPLIHPRVGCSGWRSLLSILSKFEIFPGERSSLLGACCYRCGPLESPSKPRRKSEVWSAETPQGSFQHQCGSHLRARTPRASSISSHPPPSPRCHLLPGCTTNPTPSIGQKKGRRWGSRGARTGQRV